MRKLVFVVTEDWFFVSHFLPMLQAARNVGLEPVVLTRVREHAETIEAAGGRVIALEADRRSLNPVAVASAFLGMARILRAERPAIVHCIALRSILVGGSAAMLAGPSARILAVTGGGFLTARRDRPGRMLARTLAFAVRTVLGRGRTQFLFENTDDPVSFGLSPADPAVTIVGGAGVDPSQFHCEPAKPDGPLRVALVSRMLWSKGIDLAVEATGISRAQGVDVELSLFGAPDPANPRSIPVETLREWGGRDGICWHGATSEVRSVWAAHDVACLPSRGGEGLPRSLLEAAACSRAIVTTDVPGCRSFVRDETDGLVVAPDDAPALAKAFIRLAQDRALTTRMGLSGRLRVERDGYTQDAVRTNVEDMYRRALVALNA